jgi:hypothetical protein
MYLADCVFIAIGWSGYLLIFLGLTWGMVLVTGKDGGLPDAAHRRGPRVPALLGLPVRARGGRAHWPCPTVRRVAGAGAPAADPHTGDARRPDRQVRGPGCWILLTSGTLIAFMLATEMAFYPALLELRDWMAERKSRGSAGSAARCCTGSRHARRAWDFLRGKDLEQRGRSLCACSCRRSPAGARARARAAKNGELFDAGDEEDGTSTRRGRPR